MWVSPVVLQAITDTFERTLAVLREENTTLRKLLEAAHQRTDQQATELTRLLATSAVPRMAPNVPTVPPRPRTSRDPIDGLGNVFDPVDYKDPRGMFKSEQEAALVPTIFPTTENGDVHA